MSTEPGLQDHVKVPLASQGQSLPVTVVVATRNEEANIQKCLASLAPAERRVVVDSASTDRTEDLARRAGAVVVSFEYAGGYPKKRQWALDHLGITTDWTLLIDADEVVPSPLWREIGHAICSPVACDGYLITKQFHFLGRRFRFGGFSHAAVLLIRTARARFEQLDAIADSGLDMEVHERLIVDGVVGRLQTPLVHDDRKGLAAYIDRHRHYARWEAAVRERFLSTGTWGSDAIRARPFGNAQERRRFLKQIACRMPGEPWLWFLYHFVVRLGFLEGRPGFIASRVRARYISDVRARMDALRQR